MDGSKAAEGKGAGGRALAMVAILKRDQEGFTRGDNLSRAEVRQGDTRARAFRQAVWERLTVTR